MSEHHPIDPPDGRQARRFSLRQLVVAGVACTLLGVGVAQAAQRWAASPNATDLGFARDMIDHHDQAVTMALLVVDKPDVDPVVRKFATEVLIFQRWEIGLLDSQLQGWDRSRGELERTAMTWMGMATPVAQMPGMASPAQLEQLEQASGRQADRLFLTLMREHHLGGVHMADEAAAHASDPDIRELAARMARNQRIEANEYQAVLARLSPT